MKRKVNVGITFSVDDYKKSGFFNNGIMQNVITLREVYESCKNVNKSYLINTQYDKTESPNGTVWSEYSEHIISVDEAKEKCDLIVVCQGSLHIEQYEMFKQLEKKIVKQILGAELAIFHERNLFNVPPGGIYRRNNHIDAVWMSPHYYDRDKYFFKTLFNNCDVVEAPYIWCPRFINGHIKALSKAKENFVEVYTPKAKKTKRISTMEPNISVVKTCITPLIIAELLERKYPDILEFFSVFGGEHIKKKSDMINFVSNLDINKNKKCFFESRFPVAWTLFEHTDIVLSHQNQNELNYLYLDAAWLGFPVVHNSPMMKELGWYYPDNNADIAVEHIKYLAENFDTQEHPNEKYLQKSREFAGQYLPSNSKNIKKYEKMIAKLFT